MNNLHISLTEFYNESRVLKEAELHTKGENSSTAFIAALHSDGLEEFQIYSDKIEVQRFKLKTRAFSKSLIMQIIKYLEFCIRVFCYYKKKNIKIINVHSLGLLPLGIFLKYTYKAVLVYDAHELETERNGLTGVRKKLSKILERKLIKYVDMTLVVSESIADWYTNEYKIPRPLVVLNAPYRQELKTNNHFREQLKIREDQIILLYQGALVTGRGIHLLLDAFKQRSDDTVVVVFMGYGELAVEIKQIACHYANIFLFPAVQPSVVLEYTSSADVGISFIENTCLSYYYCMPNKLFEYAMAGLPILVSNMKDMSELVTRNNMGAAISDSSPEGINYAIDHFLKKDLNEMKTNAYRIACENAWEKQEEKMLLAYQNLSSSI